MWKISARHPLQLHRTTAVASAAKILCFALHSAILDKKEKCIYYPFSIVLVFADFKHEELSWKRLLVSRRPQRWQRSCVHHLGDVAPHLCCGEDSLSGGPAPRWVPAAWLGEGLHHICGFSCILVYKCYKMQREKNATCSKWPFELSRWAAHYHLVRKVYLYARSFLCPYLFVLQGFESSPKRSRGMHPFIAASVEWGQLGIGREWNPRKYYTKLFAHLYLDCLCNYSLKKPTKPHLQMEAAKLFYWHFIRYQKNFFCIFTRGCFLKEILMKCITNIRSASAFTFPVSMELFQCC